MAYTFKYPYEADTKYKKKVAYFCMEFAIHQAFKIYAGGLGFLAGSHMRSAFDLRQNMIGIGILWKYGYYDQGRKTDRTMEVLFEEKIYGFLQKTDLKFSIKVSGHVVWVTAYYLPPHVFNTAPLFFLSTDLQENDYLAKTICYRLYDANPETRIAGSILLGEGGAKLLEHLNWEPDIYHLNESHALPLAFYLYNREKDITSVKNRLVFTNHTPEESGNFKTDIQFLEKMGFFGEIPLTEIKAICGIENNLLDHTLTALKLAGKANGVSEKHYNTLADRWNSYEGICPVGFITNAQNYRYWADKEMYAAINMQDDELLRKRKQDCKQQLFEEVADQEGEIFNKDILTIVFAKRFAGYKRADLLLHNMERFHRLVTNKERPLQIIWSGKPYPLDYAAIGIFDKIVNLCKSYTNCSILSGYEMKLSRLLKGGADVWLNVPRITHEASGTSGMTAAMTGAINLAIPDGWFPEFAKDKVNSFIIPPSDKSLPEYRQDEEDANSLYDLLENEVIPMYYDYPQRWTEMVKNSMRDIVPYFDSDRMANEYYEKLYS